MKLCASHCCWVWLLRDCLAHHSREELSDRLPRAISVCDLLTMRSACLVEAVLTVQTGDNLGFNLRSSLKPALPSTPTSQETAYQTSAYKTRSNFGGCGSLGEASKVSLQTGRHSLEVMAASGFSVARLCLSCRQFSICCHLVRLPHSLSKKVGTKWVGGLFLFSIPLIWCCLWLSEAELGFLKSQHFYEMAKRARQGGEFLENKTFLDFSPCYVHSPY